MRPCGDGGCGLRASPLQHCMFVGRFLIPCHRVQSSGVHQRLSSSLTQQVRMEDSESGLLQEAWKSRIHGTGQARLASNLQRREAEGQVHCANEQSQDNQSDALCGKS